MAGDKNSKLVFFGSIAVLAIPAVIYVMGYVYWTSYFSHFGIDLAKVNLPVYKVMVGATPAVYALIVAVVVVYLATRDVTRTESGYRLPTVNIIFAGGLVLLGGGLSTLTQPYSITLKIAIICLGSALALISLISCVRRSSSDINWRWVALALVFIPLGVFVLFKSLSEAKAGREAEKLLKGPCEECCFVAFHCSFDTGSFVTDSLILIASSESHYFVFSRTEVTEEKPRRVFAINKNSVSYVEIRSPEMHESAKHKGPAQPGPPD